MSPIRNAIATVVLKKNLMGDIIHQGGQYSPVNIVLGGHYSLMNDGHYSLVNNVQGDSIH